MITAPAPTPVGLGQAGSCSLAASSKDLWHLYMTHTRAHAVHACTERQRGGGKAAHGLGGRQAAFSVGCCYFCLLSVHCHAS